MKASTNQPLINFLLQKRPHYIADLFQITPVGGTTIYLTTQAQPITYQGHVYQPMNPFIKRGSIREEVGLSKTTSMSLTVIADPSFQINNLPFLQQVMNGYLDGADVLLLRIHMPTFGDVSLGAYIRFHGYIGPLSGGDMSKVDLEVKSNLNKLTKQMPWQLYSPGCRHSNFAGSPYLFGPGCTLLTANFVQAGTVTGTSSDTKSVYTGLTQAGSPAPPTSPPIMSDNNNGNNNLPARTLYAVYTYTTAAGETLPSPEAYISVAIQHTITVSISGAPSWATGWNVYVGLATNAEQKQNQTPMTTNYTWVETHDGDSAGLIQGIAPPQTASSSYYSGGTITFTSGKNNGVSRVIEAYENSGAGGIVVVHPLLPNKPVAGDTFNITPGCDRQMSTCNQKFNNLANFGGEPFVPIPETVI